MCVLCAAEGGTTFAQLCFVSLHQQQTGRIPVSSDTGVCVIDGGAQKVPLVQWPRFSMTEELWFPSRWAEGIRGCGG